MECDYCGRMTPEHSVLCTTCDRHRYHNARMDIFIRPIPPNSPFAPVDMFFQEQGPYLVTPEVFDHQNLTETSLVQRSEGVRVFVRPPKYTRSHTALERQYGIGRWRNHVKGTVHNS